MKFKSISICVFVLIVLPEIAFANAGVPMIFLSYPAMIAALIPVILFEAYIFRIRTEVNYKKSLVSIGIANSISTLAGFPLAWGLLLGFEMLTTGGSCGPGFDTISESIITVIVEAAWLCPWEGYLGWMIPIAFLINLIVAYFISIYSENFIVRKFHKDVDKIVIKKAVFRANTYSYLCLPVWGSVYAYGFL